MIPTEPRKILFEPWGLGDAVIAASAAREEPKKYALFCNRKWHGVIGRSGAMSIPLGATDDRHGSRHSGGFLARWFESRSERDLGRALEVNSIRGDPRDWLMMRRQFPRAKVRMTGWICFLAKQFACVDYLFRWGILNVENRYERWEKICGFSEGRIDRAYRLVRQERGDRANPRKILIHLGAQWRSRQYPRIQELKNLLQGRGFEVKLVAGPGDPLPGGVGETEVMRPSFDDLIPLLDESGLVITNDSGPMHLAAWAGARVLTLSMISNIDEWLPPGASAVSSSRMPRGYMPLKEYTSDEVLEGWPEPSDIVDRVGEVAGFQRLDRLPDAQNPIAQGGLRLKGVLKDSRPDSPLVTIITAVFNGEAHLEETIQSVLAQDYENLEFIIVDGGSKDRTLEIIKKYEDRIDYWVSARDAGIGDAFNRGLMLSRGKYINYQGDGDGLIGQQAISRVIQSLDGAEPWWIASRIRRIDQSGNTLYDSKSMRHGRFQFLFRMPYPHQGLFTHAKVFERYGLFDNQNRYAMDYEHLLRCYPNLDRTHIHNEITARWRADGVGQGKTREVLREYDAIKRKHRLAPSLLLWGIDRWSILKFLIKRVVWPELA